MILTLTANPSIDRTTTVKGRLERGGVYRLAMQSDVPGGKGVNVSAAVANAGHDTLALYPAANNGRFSRLLAETNIPHEAIDLPDEARVNLTIVEDDGTTTKLNTPGALLSQADADRILERLSHHAPGASWVVLAGSRASRSTSGPPACAPCGTPTPMPASLSTPPMRRCWPSARRFPLPPPRS